MSKALHIVYAPNPTGSGHNMRALAIAAQVRVQRPDVRQTVILSSLQDTFGPMFKSAGVEVLDASPQQVTNTAQRGHLPTKLDWEGMVTGYLVPTFLNGERVLSLLGHFRDLGADLIVSDYNPTACLAARFADLPYVLVTERFNFSLVNVTNQQLLAGGSEINPEELDRARAALNQVFQSIMQTAAAVITDKPAFQNFPMDDEFCELLSNGSAHFVGPMIRPLPSGDPQINGAVVRRELGLGQGPLVVATVGGTTMHMKNKQALINCYLETYRLLRERHPYLEMVLIGREKIDTPPGVHSFDYIPDWMGLIQDSAVLLVPPGWITVTEICALGLPAIFTLSSFSEYHEIEPFQRLIELGFLTQLGTDALELSAKADRLISSKTYLEELRDKYRAVAPDAHGASRAARIIISHL